MEHYICKGGCHGVSDNPGTCQAEGCAKHGEALEKCDCTDGKHNGAFDEDEEYEPMRDKRENK